MVLEGILAEIVTRTLEDVQRRSKQCSLVSLRQEGESRASRRIPFANALRGGRETEPRFICEAKKASPSRGLFRKDFDPGRLAAAYSEAGAAAISVVTEPHYFQGSMEFLGAVREAAPGYPLLRKDFHVHELQIFETAASPADALLFIVSTLSPTQLKDYLDMAHAFALDHLVEVTTLAEAEIALKAGATVIGINNRDLRTFEVDTVRTETILPLLLEAAVISVAESGVHSAEMVNRMWMAGVDAFLVGEALVTSENPKEKLAQLRGLLDTNPGS